MGGGGGVRGGEDHETVTIRTLVAAATGVSEGYMGATGGFAGILPGRPGYRCPDSGLACRPSSPARDAGRAPGPGPRRRWPRRTTARGSGRAAPDDQGPPAPRGIEVNHRSTVPAPVTRHGGDDLRPQLRLIGEADQRSRREGECTRRFERAIPARREPAISAGPIAGSFRTSALSAAKSGQLPILGPDPPRRRRRYPGAPRLSASAARTRSTMGAPEVRRQLLAAETLAGAGGQHDGPRRSLRHSVVPVRRRESRRGAGTAPQTIGPRCGGQASSQACSTGSKTRERVKNRTPRGASSENPPPRPAPRR